jgi:hypothetical protein
MWTKWRARIVFYPLVFIIGLIAGRILVEIHLRLREIHEGLVFVEAAVLAALFYRRAYQG